MDCPRCKTSLSSDNLRDMKITLELDNCPNCGGTWFDKGELQKLDKVIEPTFLEIRKIPDQEQQMEIMYCPSCSNHPRLEKAEHPRDKKVIFDYVLHVKEFGLIKES